MESGDKVWEVFIQKKAGLPFKHAGSVMGTTKKWLCKMQVIYTPVVVKAVSLWVVEASNIVAVPFDEADAFFDPADDKIYRHATFYNIPDSVGHM
jgi:ring-1,2-phenylacetyl-CoA epoxidase subunit PaaB